MASPKTFRCCWNCKACKKGGTRFVQNFTCMHPQVKAAMARKGVDTLDPEKLDDECPLFVDDIKAIKRRVKQDHSDQLSLL